MKKLLLDTASSINGFPTKTGTHNFYFESIQEGDAAIISSLIGNSYVGIPGADTFIFGCEMSLSGTSASYSFSISSGYAYVRGEVFEVLPASGINFGTNSGLQLLGTIVNQNRNTSSFQNADPVQFSNLSLPAINVHSTRCINFSSASSSTSGNDVFFGSSGQAVPDWKYIGTYPAKVPIFQNTYASRSSNPILYKKIGGLVNISGSVTGSGSVVSNETIFVFPELGGYRPRVDQYFTIYNATDAKQGIVNVLKTGEVNISPLPGGSLSRNNNTLSITFSVY